MADAEFMEDLGFGSSDKGAQLPPGNEPEVEPAIEQPVDETPPAEAAPAEDVVPAEPEPDQEPTGTKVDKGLQSALKAEREQRQEWERRYHEMATARVQQPQQSQKPEVDLDKLKEEREREYFDDPVGYTERRANEIANKRVAELTVRQSAARMAQEAPDYLDVMAKFKDHANTREPYLWQQLQGHQDPARAAYQYMKQLENPPQAFDAEKERERIREEERERVRKELADEAAGKLTKTPSGGTGGAAPVVKRHKSLDDLLDENESLIG